MFKLSLEEDTISPTEDDFSEEIQIDDVDDYSTDMTDVLEEGETLSQSLFMLERIRANIEKFGITKELMDLVSGDKASTGISMSKEEITEVSLEMDVYEHMKNIKKVLEDYFNKVIGAITKFFNRYFTSLGWVKAKILKIKKNAFGSNGRFVDEDDLLNKSAAAAPSPDWGLIMGRLTLAANDLIRTPFDKNHGYEIYKQQGLLNALFELGYNLTYLGSTGMMHIEKKQAPKYESKKLRELYWDVDNTNKMLNISTAYCSKIEKLKEFKPKLEKWKKEATANDPNFLVPKSIVINQVGIGTRCCNILMEAFLKYLWQLANIAGKAKMKI